MRLWLQGRTAWMTSGWAQATAPRRQDEIEPIGAAAGIELAEPTKASPAGRSVRKRRAEMTSGDRFNLERFVTAQAPVFETVLAELRAGRKRTHWMWFGFPQLSGL